MKTVSGDAFNEEPMSTQEMTPQEMNLYVSIIHFYF